MTRQEMEAIVADDIWHTLMEEGYRRATTVFEKQTARRRSSVFSVKHRGSDYRVLVMQEGAHRDLVKLLRALAEGERSKKEKLDVIFIAAADALEGK